MLAAFKLIKQNHGRSKRFFVFTDNRGVILRTQDIAVAMMGQYIYKELMTLASSLCPGTEINLVWCPGHAGIQGNEEADSWANGAAVTGPTPHLTLYVNYTKAQRQASASQIRPSSSFDKKKPRIGIRASAILSQLGSGCSNLNGYLYLIRKVAEPICLRCGYRQETTTHLFHFCPAYKVHLRTLKRDL